MGESTTQPCPQGLHHRRKRTDDNFPYECAPGSCRGIAEMVEGENLYPRGCRRLLTRGEGQKGRVTNSGDSPLTVTVPPDVHQRVLYISTI